MNDIIIRDAKECDIEQILEIYSYYVKNSLNSADNIIPSKSDFQILFKTIQKKYPFIVAERDGKLLGFAYSDKFRIRKAFSWDVELFFYVDVNQYDRNIESLLIINMEKYLNTNNIKNIYVSCVTSDKEDQYLKYSPVTTLTLSGYKKIGELHSCCYKFRNWYNLAYYEKKL